MQTTGEQQQGDGETNQTAESGEAKQDAGGASGKSGAKQKVAAAAILGIIGLGIGVGLTVATGDKSFLALGAGLAGLGVVIGYAYASHVYEKIEKASNKAEAVDKAIAKSQESIAQQQKELAALEQDNAKMDAATRQLAEDYASKRVTAANLASVKTQLDKQLVEDAKVLDGNQKELAYLEQTATPIVAEHGSDAQKKQLEGQIEILKRQNEQMQKTLEQRASFSERLSAG